MAQREDAAARRERRIITALIVVLLGTAVWFRTAHLSSIPGIDGDEGWWGVQALAWRAGQPYEARTTSGNPIDLFFLVPLAWMHGLGHPSFALLRALPALVNLLALPIGFWFVRRLYGQATAWIYTVALAIAPTAIAHSRICQDPSQSIFWTALVIYLSLLALAERRRAWLYGSAALLVFPIALWTHPTNVFIAPFVALPVVAGLASLLRGPHRLRTVAIVAGVLVLSMFAWPWLTHVLRTNESLQKPWLSLAIARMADPAQWLEFVVNYARLFNGVTIYHYFSGARPVTIPYDVGFVAVALAAGVGLWRVIGRTRAGVDVGLVAASAAMWLLFFAFAGPTALRPHAERWGLCLIVPGTLILARGITGWLETSVHRLASAGAAALVAASLLVSFQLNYFREFATSGGRSHLTYVTAPIEPKQQALEQIVAARGGTGPVLIVAQQWWLYWPIAYLARAQAGVSVSMTLSDAAPHALDEGQLYLVEFASTPELASAMEWIAARGLRSSASVIRDASGRDLLDVVRVTR